MLVSLFPKTRPRPFLRKNTRAHTRALTFWVSSSLFALAGELRALSTTLEGALVVTDLGLEGALARATTTAVRAALDSEALASFLRETTTLVVVTPPAPLAFVDSFRTLGRTRRLTDLVATRLTATAALHADAFALSLARPDALKPSGLEFSAFLATALAGLVACA